jgi:hypothetical protein
MGIHVTTFNTWTSQYQLQNFSGNVIVFEFHISLLNHDLFSDAVSVSDYTASNSGMISERRIGKHMEDGSYRLILDATPECFGKDWGKSLQRSVRTAGLPAEIYKCNLPLPSTKEYQHL